MLVLEVWAQLMEDLCILSGRWSGVQLLHGMMVNSWLIHLIWHRRHNLVRVWIISMTTIIRIVLHFHLAANKIIQNRVISAFDHFRPPKVILLALARHWALCAVLWLRFKYHHIVVNCFRKLPVDSFSWLTSRGKWGSDMVEVVNRLAGNVVWR
jgi:hypothetical protein